METAAAPLLDQGAGRVTLSVRDVEVVYGGAILGLRGVSLDVPAGAVTALLGANGAGKTTLLRAVTGLLGLQRGRITRGSVLLDGQAVTGRDPARLVRGGMSQVMEGRRIFPGLTVDENLRAGGFTVRRRAARAAAHQRVMDLFPPLASRRSQLAGYLSGGEQQMLAIGRALMQSPRLLLLDEPSLGLAPRIVEQIAGLIRTLNAQGTSVLLAEQSAAMALSVADHAYVLQNGSVVNEGPAASLNDDCDIQQHYLGGGGAGRRSLHATGPRRPPMRSAP